MECAAPAVASSRSNACTNDFSEKSSAVNRKIISTASAAVQMSFSVDSRQRPPLLSFSLSLLASPRSVQRGAKLHPFLLHSALSHSCSSAKGPNRLVSCTKSAC
eukprot:6214493-Pleurochrysis_carterae.AAC.3